MSSLDLTYSTNPTGPVTAPDGTVLSPDLWPAVDFLAHLQGWASKVIPPDMGADTFMHITTPGNTPHTEEQMQALVRICDIYGVEHKLEEEKYIKAWTLSVTFGSVTFRIKAQRLERHEPVTQEDQAKAKLFAPRRMAYHPELLARAGSNWSGD